MFPETRKDLSRHQASSTSDAASGPPEAPGDVSVNDATALSHNSLVLLYFSSVSKQLDRMMS